MPVASIIFKVKTKYIIIKIKFSYFTVLVEFHRWLIDSQLKRHEADYEMSPNLSHDDVRELIENAEKMLNFARQYFEIEKT